MKIHTQKNWFLSRRIPKDYTPNVLCRSYNKNCLIHHNIVSSHTYPTERKNNNNFMAFWYALYTDET